MALVWQYGEKSGNEAWKGLSWGMVSSTSLLIFSFSSILQIGLSFSFNALFRKGKVSLNELLFLYLLSSCYNSLKRQRRRRGNECLD